MSLIFIDTETKGVPQRSDAPITEIDNWPLISQIAWIVCDNTGAILKKENFTTSLSFTPPNSDHYQTAKYKPIHEIIPKLKQDLASCVVVIGHNIEFDINVIGCEFYRLGFDPSLITDMSRFCTMKETVDYCNFSYNGKYRYPKLQELYTKLFAMPFENAHDAYCDIMATYNCFEKLVELEVFKNDEQLFLFSKQERKEIGLKLREEGLKHTGEDKIEYFILGAELGDVVCQEKLARNYEIEGNLPFSIKWYKRAAANGHIESYLTLAKIAEDENEKQLYYRNWYDAILREIKEGDKYAHYTLATSFWDGNNGLNKNRSEAISLLKTGVDKGYSGASILADYLFEEKRYSEFFPYLMKNLDVAEDYDKTIELNIIDDKPIFKIDKDLKIISNTYFYQKVGIAYYKGYGTNVDYNTARVYFLKSIKLSEHLFREYLNEYFASTLSYSNLRNKHSSLKESFYYMGEIYEQGLGDVSVNFIAAAEFYSKAYFRKCERAGYRIGCLYYYGDGVERDIEKAEMYLSESIRNGIYEASKYLNEISDEKKKKE